MEYQPYNYRKLITAKNGRINLFSGMNDKLVTEYKVIIPEITYILTQKLIHLSCIRVSCCFSIKEGQYTEKVIGRHMGRFGRTRGERQVI